MQLTKSSLSAAITLALAVPAQPPIVDLNTAPLDGDSDPKAGVSVGGVAYFVATTAFGAELWRSDGASAGAYVLKDMLPSDSGRRGSAAIRDLTVVGNKVFFAASPSGYGAEVWVFDGTPLGTRLGRDILAGYDRSSAVHSLISFRGKLYVVADSGPLGNEPWMISLEVGSRAAAVCDCLRSRLPGHQGLRARDQRLRQSGARKWQLPAVVDRRPTRRPPLWAIRRDRSERFVQQRRVVQRRRDGQGRSLTQSPAAPTSELAGATASTVDRTGSGSRWNSKPLSSSGSGNSVAAK